MDMIEEDGISEERLLRYLSVVKEGDVRLLGDLVSAYIDSPQVRAQIDRIIRAVPHNGDV